MHTRRKHLRSVFGPWWGVVMAAWTAISSADTLVGKYTSDAFKKSWEAAWIVPKWGWKTWIIGMLAITVVFVVEITYKLVWKAEADALERESVLKGQLGETKARIYEGRPVFVLELRRWSEKGWSFYLKNCGQRTARYVQLGKQNSVAGNYELHFKEAPLLEPDREKPIAWWVTKSGGVGGTLEYSEMLFAFLNDVPKQTDPGEMAVFIWFDVPITFRDMDESPCDAIVRFCFDLESQMLKAAAVPYTERKLRPKQP